MKIICLQKLRPFIQLNDYDQDKVAIINCDDDHAMDFIGATNGKILTYACQKRADVFAEDIVYALERTEFSLYIKGEYITRMTIPLLENIMFTMLLSVLAYFYSLDYDLLEIVSYIENVSGIEGTI